MPIAPRRHSAASTLSNSGEYILSTWPLLRLRLEADAYADFIDAASLAVVSALLKSSLSARHSFFGNRSGACRSRAALLACAWRSTPQLPSQRIRAWRERTSVTVLRKWCTVRFLGHCQVDVAFSIVVSDPRFHNRRCGLDPTAVSPAPPFSQVFKTLPMRSTAHANVARDGSKDAEVLSERRGSPLGLLSCGCLESGVAIHMGIMRSRYERLFLLSPPAGSFAYAFADRRLLCSKHWCSQPRFGAVLDGGCAAARQIRWRAVHNPRVRQLERVVETSA